MTKKERQEMLLCSFYDGQSGFFGTLKAKRLLARSSEARNYFEQLGKISAASQSWFNLDENSRDSAEEISLWKQVSQRIDQEERAAFYLGSRRLSLVGADKAGRTALIPTLSAGFAGTMAVAAMAMFIFLPASDVGILNNSTSSEFTAGVGPQEIATRGFRDQSDEGVNFVSHERAEPLRITESRLNRAMEVDWMRSQGRVRLIQSPSERSAIIWVKRDTPEQVIVQDEDTPIRIINDRVPTTRSAFGE